MAEGDIQTLRNAQRQLVSTGFKDLVYDLAPLMPQPDRTRRNSRGFATTALLWPSAATLAATGKPAATLRAEGHDRIAETWLALVAALLGFATLLQGQFSRFGAWRQIVSATFLVILVKGIETLTTAAVRDTPDRWWLAYLPVLAGLAVVAALLARVTSPALRLSRGPGSAP
jgi:lipopolysaccharide export system permease protein